MEKWAAVTGAAVRTGRACALHLAECGYHLILHCRRSTEELQTLAAALNAKGLQTCTITADFSQDDGVGRFWNAANIPGLRVIVNNAAVYCPDTTDTALFRRQLKINYETVYEIMCRTEAERSGCTVVNFLDGRLEAAKGKFSGYYLSKRLAAEATACFAAVSGRNRYYGIAPKALLPPVIAENVPDSRKKWRFTGTDVLKPVFDEILAGHSPSGTVFTV